MNRTLFPESRHALALLASLFAANGAVFAQTMTADSQDNGPALGTIEITGNRLTDNYAVPNASTGTKTDTPVMETPVSIQVVPQQVLEDQHTFSLEQTLTNVSGVFSGGEEPGQEYLTIRGFTTTATLWNGFRLDEYSTTGGGTIGAAILDNAEKVEVLKGPAGILYGRVEPGGMVNVVTKQPLAQYQGEAELDLGSWNDARLAADVTGPIDTDRTWLYRLNAAQEYSASWMWNTGLHSTVVAPVLSWKPTPSTQISLEGLFRHEGGPGGVSSALVDPSNNEMVPVNPAFNPLPSQSGTDLSRLYADVEHRFDERWSLSWKVLHTLTVVPEQTYSYVAYAYFPAAGPNDYPIDRNVVASASRNRTDATMLDFVGHADGLGMQHTLLLGGDLYHTPITMPIYGYSCCQPTNFYDPSPLAANAAFVPTPAYVPTNPLSGGTGYTFGGDSVQSSIDYGLYVQDQVKLPGNIHLLIGERYQHYLQTSAANGQVGAPLVSNPSLVDHAFTPRFGALWRPDARLSVYYSYAENFGNNTGFTFPGTPLKPENSRQNEIGAKTEWLDGRLTGSIAAYNLAKYHLATGDPLHYGYNLLVGAVRSKGVEFDLQGSPMPGWNVLVNASFVQPYVLEGAGAYNTGTRFPGVPEHQFNAWSTYALRGDGWRGLRLGGGANWAASAAYPGTHLEQPAYWTASLFAAYERVLATRHVSVQINVNNVFNRTYFVNLYPVPSANYTDLNYGNPREVRLTLRTDL
jgi:iron complex outermembrane receptor protein